MGDPATELYVPGEQSWQVVLLVAPISSEYLPASQPAHSAAPSSEEKVPFLQGMQYPIFKRSLNLPTGQGEQEK